MLKGILSISGHGGLFKMVAEAKNNIIVESLSTNKRMPAYSTSKISSLEDIAIYADSGDIPLKDVFKNIYDLENGGTAIDGKSSNNDLKAYFAKVLPDYDRERVYVSDIKKVLTWYNELHKYDLLMFEEESAEDLTDDSQTTEEKPEKE